MGEEPRVQADGGSHSVVSNGGPERCDATKRVAADHEVCQVKLGFGSAFAERVLEERFGTDLVN